MKDEAGIDMQLQQENKRLQLENEALRLENEYRRLATKYIELGNDWLELERRALLLILDFYRAKVELARLDARAAAEKQNA